jgi:catechol 2,3-dioxygenase-like lactoylglutathione lyase family enzyme
MPQEAAMTTTDAKTDMKLEVVIIPVADVDRARNFYTRIGWRLDGDFAGDDGSRALQFNPPGSGCSIQFGANITDAAPGTAQGLHLIVSDIDAARANLLARGVEVTPVYHCDSGYFCRYPTQQAKTGRIDGAAPDHGTYGSFASFSDPDGNGWVLQEVTTRFPGRVDPSETSFSSANDLASALRRAAAAHHEHEARTGEKNRNWPDWYSAYMVAEHAGAELPT